MFRGKIIYLCLITLAVAQENDVKIKSELASDNMSVSEDLEIDVVKRARLGDDDDDDDDPGTIQKITNRFNGAVYNAWNKTMSNVFGNLFTKKKVEDSEESEDEEGFVDKVIASPWFQPIFNSVVSRLAGTPTEPRPKSTVTKKTTTTSTTKKTIEETNNEEDDKDNNEDEDK